MQNLHTWFRTLLFHLWFLYSLICNWVSCCLLTWGILSFQLGRIHCLKVKQMQKKSWMYLLESRLGVYLEKHFYKLLIGLVSNWGSIFPANASILIETLTLKADRWKIDAFEMWWSLRIQWTMLTSVSILQEVKIKDRLSTFYSMLE